MVLVRGGRRWCGCALARVEMEKPISQIGIDRNGKRGTWKGEGQCEIEAK